MHLVGFIIRIYHDTRLSECQNWQKCFPNRSVNCHVTYNTLFFNLILKSGLVSCWSCSRNVSALPGDGSVKAETCCSVTVWIKWCHTTYICKEHIYIMVCGSIYKNIHSFHSLVFSLRGRAGRNQSPVMWPVWLCHTASRASSWE